MMLSFLNHSRAHSDDQDNSQEVGSGDLEAICCICEKGLRMISPVPRSKVELQVRQLPLARRGVRDKIPLLRMTKGPEKEFVWCVVEKNEADDIFGGMARAVKLQNLVVGLCTRFPSVRD